MSRYNVIDPVEYFEGQLLAVIRPPYNWESEGTKDQTGD